MKKLILGLIKFGFIGLFFWLLFIAFKYLLENFWLQTSDNIKAALLAGTVTIIGSFISVTYGKLLEKKKEIEFQLRLKKEPEYKKFVDLIIDIIRKGKNGKNIAEDEATINKLFAFTSTLILWGSEDVIKEWSKFRKRTTGQTTQDDPLSVLKQMAKVLIAIRKDIGIKDKNLTEKEILGLFINDIDEVWK